VSLTPILNAVKGIIAAVANVGNVYAYRRAVQTEKDFSDLYIAGGKVLAWDITRESTASIDRTVGATEEKHLVVVRGYMGVSDKDATEQTFQDLIEAVRAALRLTRNLNGAVLDTTPLQARTVTAAVIGGVLCHYCELTFEAIEFPLSTT
jgi:hypothetical protein